MTTAPEGRAAEETEILRIAAGGDGVGRLRDGRTVFVPRTAPGDLVRLRDVVRHARFARARADAVLRASPDRVEPVCVHASRDRCGGCALQHIGPAAQLRAKASIVGDALRRIGKFDVADPEVVPNPRPFGWRSRVTFVPGPDGAFGMHPEGEPRAVFPVVRCEIASPAIQALWDVLRGPAAALAAGVDRLTLREDETGGLHVVLSGPGPDRDAFERALDAPFSGGARPRVSVASDDAGDGFEQVDRATGDRVRRHATETLLALAPGPLDPAAHAWDLYAGRGETAALLAAQGLTVDAVELDRRASDALASRALPGVRAIAGRVEDAFPRLRAPSLVVLNPPRTGAGPRVVEGLLRAAPRAVAYVSCDPATLARDAALLRGRYALRSVRAFDAFPQTAHVETVLVFVRD